MEEIKNVQYEIMGKLYTIQEINENDEIKSFFVELYKIKEMALKYEKQRIRSCASAKIYYNKNKELCDSKSREYGRYRYNTDEEFRNKKKAKALERSNKLKNKNSEINLLPNLNETTQL